VAWTKTKREKNRVEETAPVRLLSSIPGMELGWPASRNSTRSVLGSDILAPDISKEIVLNGGTTVVPEYLQRPERVPHINQPNKKRHRGAPQISELIQFRAAVCC
jgi:hypothetical protein